MGTVTVSINDEIEKKFRAVAGKLYSRKKGYLGKAITEAMQKWIDEKKQKEIAEEELKVLERGFEMGRLRIKTRAEIYER